MKERIRALRKELGLTLEEFGRYIGMKKNSLSQIENGKNNVTEQTLLSICKTNWNGKTVNEDWLRTGQGEMFLELPEDDEIAAYVSELLEDDGNNALYTIIKEIMHTYSELSPKSQEVLRDASAKLLENLKKRS